MARPKKPPKHHQTSGQKAVLEALTQLPVCKDGGTKTPREGKKSPGFPRLPAISSLAPWGSGRCGDPSPRGPSQLTLAVFRLAEALLLLREAVADTEAGFNPPAFPRLVPTNDAAAP